MAMLTALFLPQSRCGIDADGAHRGRRGGSDSNGDE